MNYSTAPDSSLLATVMGCSEFSASNLLLRYSNNLLALFGESVVCKDGQALRRLHAARELFYRSLGQELAIRPSLAEPNAVRNFLLHRLSSLEHEVFYCIFLDAQNRLISAVEMFRGTLTQASVYPREVVKRSLANNAAAVIFAHNHPSGIAVPSDADRAITYCLKKSLSLIDVRVLDHFIVANGTIFSFAEAGLI